MRETFRHVRQDRAFRRLGFTLVGSVDDRLLADLRSVSQTLFVGERVGFHSSTESRDLGYREALFDRLVPLCRPFVDEHIKDHDFLNVALLIKFSGDDGAMGPHQDWTMVDESRHRSFNLWIPLVDVDETNGALSLLPGSHKVLSHPRCSPGLPHSYDDPLRELVADDLTTVRMRAGEVLATDHALVHMSRPNMTAEPRPAIVLALVPAEASLLHDFRRPDDRVERFRIDDRAWFRSFHMGDRPRGVPPIGLVPFEPAQRSAHTLVRESQRATRKWPRPKVSNATEDIGPPAKADRTPAEPRAATMRRPDLQREFEELGFIVVDLLSPTAVEGVKAAYAELDHAATWDSPFAAGFHTTLYDERIEYRREVLSAIERAFAPAIEEHLADYEVLFANFAVKSGGGEAVPSHLDWTFVEESRFSSATVWCALSDIGDEMGTLGVVPGSHRHVSFVRPVNHRDYGAHALASQGSGTLLPMRAGQAVILDNRTVHFSSPNRTANERVAAAAVVVPSAGEALHYWADDERLRELVVSRDFFLHYRIGEDPRRVVGVLEERDGSHLSYA